MSATRRVITLATHDADAKKALEVACAEAYATIRDPDELKSTLRFLVDEFHQRTALCGYCYESSGEYTPKGREFMTPKGVDVTTTAPVKASCVSQCDPIM